MLRGKLRQEGIVFIDLKRQGGENKRTSVGTAFSTMWKLPDDISRHLLKGQMLFFVCIVIILPSIIKGYCNNHILKRSGNPTLFIIKCSLWGYERIFPSLKDHG